MPNAAKSLYYGAMILTLDVKPRDSKESKDALRKSGTIPAVFYGPKEGATPIAINARSLENIWKAAGETTIITLRGAGEEKDTLIKDVQVDPVTGALVHADFYVLEKGKKITLNIPLEFVGQAPAEKAGHILVKALHEIEIEVAPAEIPHNLTIDLSKLENVGDHVTAGDIALPPSATLLTHAEEIVASITAFHEEKQEAAPAPEAAADAAAAPAAEEAPAPAEEK